MNNKKRILLTAIIVVYIAVLIVLSALSYIIESLVIDVARFVVGKSTMVLLAVAIMHRWMKKEIPEKCTFLTAVFGVVIALDLVVVGAARFIVTGASGIVLFIPAAIPVCCLVMIPHILASAKYTDAEDKKKAGRIANLILYPLLALSIYFEIISFM